MAENFLGELRLMSFPMPPKGWAACNGQLLPIAQNQALFSLLGTSYGGDGRSTFALPNLQGRAIVGQGSSSSVGTTGGSEQVTLTTAQIPPHTHTLMASAATASTTGGNVPTGKAVAQGFVGTDPGAAITLYGTGTADRTMAGGAITTVGGQAHENRQPFLAMNYCIALVGIYPSRA